MKQTGWLKPVAHTVGGGWSPADIFTTYVVHRDFRGAKIVIFDVTSVATHQSLLSFFEKRGLKEKPEKRKKKKKALLS